MSPRRPGAAAETVEKEGMMIQAWVTTPRGSLYYAAEATPYNLSNLRSHIRAMKRYGGNWG